MSSTLDTHRLVVTAGTQRGLSCALSDELTNLGAADDNHIVLNDPQVLPHHATIARRGDRFALYVPAASRVQVEGAVVPCEQWVWLPNEATLQLTPQTVLQLQSGDATAARSSKARGAKKPKELRKTARFVTDHDGETGVRLGEDGKLPELQLRHDQAAARSTVKASGGGNPVLLYAALGFSLLASVVLLFVDAETAATSEGKAAARSAIASEFLGGDVKSMKPYQRLLRDASLAHSRGDANAEREAYRAVLKRLNSEDRNPFTGVTGNLQDDERLRRYLGILLAR